MGIRLQIVFLGTPEFAVPTLERASSPPATRCLWWSRSPTVRKAANRN